MFEQGLEGGCLAWAMLETDTMQEMTSTFLAVIHRVFRISLGISWSSANRFALCGVDMCLLMCVCMLVCVFVHVEVTGRFCLSSVAFHLKRLSEIFTELKAHWYTQSSWSMTFRDLSSYSFPQSWGYGCLLLHLPSYVGSGGPIQSWHSCAVVSLPT